MPEGQENDGAGDGRWPCALRVSSWRGSPDSESGIGSEQELPWMQLGAEVTGFTDIIQGKRTQWKDAQAERHGTPESGMVQAAASMKETMKRPEKQEESHEGGAIAA